MKHLLFILVFVVLGYALWTMSDKEARTSASKFVTTHLIRLGFLIVVVLLLVVAAANLPSTHLL